MSRTYTRTPAVDRFWSKVDRRGPDECWPWTGTRISTGYGQLWENGRHRPATHISVRISGREVPPKAVVMHSCDNPPCVNPTHLVVADAVANSMDMVRKGRQNLAHQRRPEWRERMSEVVRQTWASYTPEQRRARVTAVITNRAAIALPETDQEEP